VAHAIDEMLTEALTTEVATADLLARAQTRIAEIVG
jgi:hypothetical protein